MAHSPETKQAVRRSYIQQRLPLSVAAVQHGVSQATAAAWKKQAKEQGDDWDKVRTATRIAAGGVGDATTQMLEDFSVLFQTTMDDIRNGNHSGLEKAEAISRLSDAYAKVMKAAGGANPKLSELAIALRVIELFAQFIQEQYPDDLQRFVAILEPFGLKVSEVFG